jgi:hypothetical protein
VENQQGWDSELLHTGIGESTGIGRRFSVVIQQDLQVKKQGEVLLWR